MAEKNKLNRPDADLSTRPTKRPRTTLIPIPDGFSNPEPPQPKPKVVYKPPTDLNFKSVFETGPTALDSDSSVSKKVVSKGTHRLMTSGTFATRSTPEHDVSKTRKPALVRPLKPPVFSTPPRPQPKTNQDQRQSTETTFRRIPPAFLEPSTSKTAPESSKHKSLRPAPPPPPPIPPSHKPHPELKPLQPPPLPSPSKKGKEKETSQANFRTISTTHIALATDLTSQAGSASLLSIFLQGNKPDVGVLGEREEEKEVRRGVGVSPVKSGGKRRGFIRNGLAERASSFISRSQTAFGLWHKETSSKLSSTATTSRRPTADLHLHILKVLHEPPPPAHSHSRSTHTARPIVALCRVVKSPQNGSGGSLTDDIYPVLFSSPVPPSSNPAEGLEEGREVYVWKPWYTVELPEPGISVAYSEAMGTQSVDGWGATSRRSKHALLCSRFFITMT